MNGYIGPALIGVGGFAILVAHYCERYHARRFQEHVDALELAHERGDDRGIRYEVRNFYEDRRVDWAISGMFWGHVAGIGLLMVGVLVLLA